MFPCLSLSGGSERWRCARKEQLRREVCDPDPGGAQGEAGGGEGQEDPHRAPDGHRAQIGEGIRHR